MKIHFQLIFLLCFSSKTFSQNYVEIKYSGGIRDHLYPVLIILRDSVEFNWPRTQIGEVYRKISMPRGAYNYILLRLREAFNQHFVDSVDTEDEIANSGYSVSFYYNFKYSERYYSGPKYARKYLEGFRAGLLKNAVYKELSDEIEEVLD